MADTRWLSWKVSDDWPTERGKMTNWKSRKTKKKDFLEIENIKSLRLQKEEKRFKQVQMCLRFFSVFCVFSISAEFFNFSQFSVNKQRELRSAFNHQVVKCSKWTEQNLENHAESILLVGLACFAKLYFPFYTLENTLIVNGPSMIHRLWTFDAVVIPNKGFMYQSETLILKFWPDKCPL